MYICTIIVLFRMAFVKGQKKLGGKVKGTPNKKTLILETFAQTIVEGGMEKFLDELMKLKGSEFIYSYMTLFEYVKPKLARVESKVDSNVNMQGSLTIQVLNESDNEAINKL